MKQYKAYVFDMDLTLLNTINTANHSYDLAFRAVGYEFDHNTVTHHLSIPLTASYAEIANPKGTYKDFFDAFMVGSNETMVRDSFIYEDGIRLLNKLKSEGELLGIVTNRNIDVVLKVLEKAGIENYFSSIITCDKVKNLKPNPEPIEACLKELNVSKEEMVYIGDAKNDRDASYNAGVDFIAVERYNNCQFDCKIKVHSMDEILIK